MNKILQFIGFIIWFFCFFGCKEKSETFYNKEMIQIKDSLLTQVILRYIERNDIEPLEKGLQLYFMGEVNRDKFVITNTYFDIPLLREWPPDYYTELNNISIFIYTGYDKYFTRSWQFEELAIYLSEKNVIFDSVPKFYNPRRWVIDKCFETNEYKVQTEFSPDTITYLPCNYALTKDSTNYPPFKVILK